MKGKIASQVVFDVKDLTESGQAFKVLDAWRHAMKVAIEADLDDDEIFGDTREADTCRRYGWACECLAINLLYDLVQARRIIKIYKDESND